MTSSGPSPLESPKGTNLRIVATIDPISGTVANVLGEFVDAENVLLYATSKHIIDWRAGKKEN